ncbi:ABC transporter permease subunit [Streptomyces sp. NPDC003032]
MTDTVTPRRPGAVPVGRDGFPQLLRAEWTKLRTVRAWGLTLVGAIVVTVLISLFSATSSSVAREGGGGPPSPAGPGGQPIHDSFTFAHRTLTGDGSITARVGGLTGAGSRPAPEWAKAGVLVKESTRPGTDYAAVLLTARHGVRMQSGFTRDTAGSGTPADGSRWLRLTREGAVLTGYESTDGRSWDELGRARLDAVSGPVEAGLFVASPTEETRERKFGNVSLTEVTSRSTARFDEVTLGGRAASGDWRHTDVGGEGGGAQRPGGEGGLRRTGDGFTLTGSGDIGPAPAGGGDLAVKALNGAQLGLVLIAAVGVLFVTAEYRRGMIRTTFVASPRRGRVLVAKAAVIGAVAFAVGLVASFASYLVSEPVLRDNGHRPPVFPDISLADGPVLRAVVGTAAVLALIAVLALGLGALMRSTAAAIATVVVVFVLPLVLLSALPLNLAHALQRLTPIAGFAIQNTVPRFDQVATVCLPAKGCSPQSPWTGLATLVAYVAVVLGAAVWRLRRRDA